MPPLPPIFEQEDAGRWDPYIVRLHTSQDRTVAFFGATNWEASAQELNKRMQHLAKRKAARIPKDILPLVQNGLISSSRIDRNGNKDIRKVLGQFVAFCEAFWPECEVSDRMFCNVRAMEAFFSFLGEWYGSPNTPQNAVKYISLIYQHMVGVLGAADGAKVTELLQAVARWKDLRSLLRSQYKQHLSETCNARSLIAKKRWLTLEQQSLVVEKSFERLLELLKRYQSSVEDEETDPLLASENVQDVGMEDSSDTSDESMDEDDPTGQVKRLLHS